MVKMHWAGLTILTFAGITLFSLWPVETLPAVPGSDKTHHLIAYTVLVLPVALRKPKNWLLIVLCFIVGSGLIELLQSYVNRYGEWLDMLANTVGIICGMVLAGIVNFFWTTRAAPGANHTLSHAQTQPPAVTPPGSLPPDH